MKVRIIPEFTNFSGNVRPEQQNGISPSHFEKPRKNDDGKFQFKQVISTGLIAFRSNKQTLQGVQHMKKSTISFAIGLALVSTSALAGKSPPPSLYSLVTTTSGSTSKNNTNAYAGLNWSMGGSWTPALVLGVFRTKVKSDGDTQGANLSFHLNLAGGIKPGKLKLSYINGKENIQGEIGAGYDFMRSAPLLGLGLNGPFVSVGVDGYLSQGLVPYVTLQSQGKFSKPAFQNSTACVVDNVNGIYADPACQFVD